ncbi:MAG: hypothetical protein RIK87_01835 [Fuerstiella sp.]
MSIRRPDRPMTACWRYIASAVLFSRPSAGLTLWRKLSVCLLTGLLLNHAADPVPAQQTEPKLKVVEHIWGFDGRVQPGQFNPLSILLDNQTADAIDATATLQRVQGMLNVTGGQYVQPVFIAPAARRWIQFYPYVADSHQCEWRLEFDGRKIEDFTQPRAAWKLSNENTEQPPQVVILDRAGRITTQPAALKHLPENIFPPYATVTFGLHTVFLDHEPDWELPRQEAFMSWLKQGGRLHVLKDSRGEYPRFGGALLDLNQPLDRFTLGSGVVVRHAVQRGDVTEDLVRRVVVLDVLKGADEEFEQAIQEQMQQTGQGLGVAADTEPSSIDESFFRQMRELTLPDHAWWLIFLLALCYIGLIFPGCFLLSKRKDMHFLTTYGAIVGLSMAFSALFLVIGRRGYGETTNLQTLAVARAEDNTHWSVFEWNALFVTTGDDYSAGADDQQAVLSTADTMDRADAQVVTGNNAKIAMRIPPFSSQTFVDRRRLTSADWKLKIQDLDIQPSGLVKLQLSTGPDFPAGEHSQYLVLAGRRVYEMKYDPENRILQLFGQKQSLAQVCQPRFDYSYSSPWDTRLQNDDRTEREIFYDEALQQLMQRSLLDDLVNRPVRFELPSDRLRLYVYTEIPEEFSLRISADVSGTGRILFTKDLFLQERATDGRQPVD